MQIFPHCPGKFISFDFSYKCNNYIEKFPSFFAKKDTSCLHFPHLLTLRSLDSFHLLSHFFLLHFLVGSAVVENDLTKENVDAIVNTANSWLKHGGGVSDGFLFHIKVQMQFEITP